MHLDTQLSSKNVTANSGFERRASPIHSQGLFTTRNFKSGEIIYTHPVGRKVLAVEINLLTTEEQDRLEKRGDGIYELMQPPACYLNHSCEPNAQEKDHIGYALRDIRAGEEITVDYTLSIEGGPMQCNCGSGVCKKVIAAEIK